MKKIIIVDDEYFVRMGIKTIVARKDSEYSIVGEAENGTAALALILEQQPDMVFLDITMPGMDGLEVLEKVRQEGYTGFVAMLTCHEEFSLAQKAIRNGADDYVLKNELAGEAMLDYLDRVSEKVESRSGGKYKEDEDELQEKKDKHFYKDNFLKNILQMGGLSREEFARGCSRYGVKIHADGIYIITIYMKHWKHIVERYKDSDLQVLFKAIDNMMDEIFREYSEWEGFYSDPFCYHILFTCSKEKSMLKVEDHIRKIVNNIAYHFERILDIDIVTAVYRNKYSFQVLYKSYEESQLLLQQSFFWPEVRLFWDGVQHTCELWNPQELEQALDKREEGKSIFFTVEEFLKKQSDRLIDKKTFFSVLSERLALPKDMEQYEDVKELLEDVKLQERRLEDEGADGTYSFLVRQALQIINKEFVNKITLEEVADRLGISAGYFSRIFSSETQETFSNYVIRKRIEYAKELIGTTNYKFYEIAEMCGFSSSVHFNNTFKKLCNVTPNQYRKGK